MSNKFEAATGITEEEFIKADDAKLDELQKVIQDKKDPELDFEFSRLYTLRAYLTIDNNQIQKTNQEWFKLNESLSEQSSRQVSREDYETAKFITEVRFPTSVNSGPPSEEDKATSKDIAKVIKEAALQVELFVPDSLSKEYAKKYLESALMWANKAIFNKI